MPRVPWIPSIVTTLVVGCAPARPPAASASPTSSRAAPLALGETFRLPSTVLGEERVINGP